MKTERLFEITFILLEKKSATAKELAERFGVSVRTIYRDLDILSACGIPVYTEQGRHGGIYLIEKYALNKTLLTDAEQSQVVMALQSLQATGQEDVAAPLSKLKGIFQKNIEDWIEIDFSSWGSSGEEKELFSMIRESIRQSRPLEFTYVNTQGESSLRTVEPYKLVFKGQSWYLSAFCRTKKEIRIFKLSRMEQPKIVDGFFTRQMQTVSGEDEHEKIEQAARSVKVKLKLDASEGWRVMDEFRGDILETGEDYYIIEKQIEDAAWLLPYLLGFGDRLEILEPTELRDRYVKLLKRMLQKHTI